MEKCKSNASSVCVCVCVKCVITDLACSSHFRRVGMLTHAGNHAADDKHNPHTHNIVHTMGTLLTIKPTMTHANSLSKRVWMRRKQKLNVENICCPLIELENVLPKQYDYFYTLLWLLNKLNKHKKNTSKTCKAIKSTKLTRDLLR